MKIRSSLTVFSAVVATMFCFEAAAQTNSPAPVQAPRQISGPTFEYPRSDLGRERFDMVRALSTARPEAAERQYASVSSFAKCAANVSPSLSARLLSAEPQSGQAAVLTRQLRGISKGCAPAGSYVPHAFFRAAIAESMYRMEAPVGGVSRAAGTPLPKSVETLSECLFVQSPAAVDDLLRSEPGSEAERAAVSRLSPFAGRCAVPGGRVDLAEVSPFLRAGLAEYAYGALKS